MNPNDFIEREKKRKKEKQTRKFKFVYNNNTCLPKHWLRYTSIPPVPISLKICNTDWL